MNFNIMKNRNKNIEDFLKSAEVRAVRDIDIENRRIRYDELIRSNRIIEKITGDEELVRAILTTKLVNLYQYKLDKIEFERTYAIGRPKVNKPRIDLIVNDEDDNPFLFIELKSPEEFESQQDEIIEKQLFNIAALEMAAGRTVTYLALVSCDLNHDKLINKAIVIDYSRYKSFDDWKQERIYTDELPSIYGMSVKSPYIKGSDKDLIRSYSKNTFLSVTRNLHNVLWGGGGTDDNEVFSSLVNIILAKIQDESEKSDGEQYDFQTLIYNSNGEERAESKEELFTRINALYRRALKERMYITEDEKLNKSYVISEEKFSLSKLKYAVSVFEKYSLVDGKNNLEGKDILGDFFEGIIRTGFKQSKGQFFTHTNIVRFILWALQLDKLAVKRMNEDKQLPYLIDPSAGSATFLIEYMRFITMNIKHRCYSMLSRSRDVEDAYTEYFLPDHRENKWAKKFIYGIENNFNLGTASKVNMILHGDGSTNIFVKDGLLGFEKYVKQVSPNVLQANTVDDVYNGLPVNKQFDVVLSNPPFSVELEQDTKESLSSRFMFANQKNSENLFIERYYQLLRENGRMGIVLPESVFDTTENTYIRLFLYKYFKIKAIVSLPQSTFAPFTNTKTSVLFAQKKKVEEIETWDKEWKIASERYSWLRKRVLNLIDVYSGKKNRSSLPSIKALNVDEEITILKEFLEPLRYNIENTSSDEILTHYEEDIKALCNISNKTRDQFGHVNTWWVFTRVSKFIDYSIYMAKADNVGYKRNKRGEISQDNDLYRESKDSGILVDDGINGSILDDMRMINWD